VTFSKEITSRGATCPGGVMFSYHKAEKGDDVRWRHKTGVGFL